MVMLCILTSPYKRKKTTVAGWSIVKISLENSIYANKWSQTVPERVENVTVESKQCSHPVDDSKSFVSLCNTAYGSSFRFLLHLYPWIHPLEDKAGLGQHTVCKERILTELVGRVGGLSPPLSGDKKNQNFSLRCHKALGVVEILSVVCVCWFLFCRFFYVCTSNCLIHRMSFPFRFRFRSNSMNSCCLGFFLCLLLCTRSTSIPHDKHFFVVFRHI